MTTVPAVPSTATMPATATAAASTDFPYNPRNRLLTPEALNRVLRAYGHDWPVRDVNTFRKAFTHRSYCTRKNENFVEGNAACPPDCLPLQEESSERLEFLGDAVLNLIVAEYLFHRYPDENEGFLTRMRSKLVNGEMLRDLCLSAGLDAHVIVSRQIEDAGGRRAKAVLEDCFEAFIGAMFVDAARGVHGEDRGYVAAARWVTGFLEANVDFTDLIAQHASYKDTLTKFFQFAFHCAPRYTVDEEEVPAPDAATGEAGGTYTLTTGSSTDPASSLRYTVCVRTRDDVIVGTGTAATKKAAENEAARKALVYFGQLQQE